MITSHPPLNGNVLLSYWRPALSIWTVSKKYSSSQDIASYICMENPYALRPLLNVAPCMWYAPAGYGGAPEDPYAAQFGAAPAAPAMPTVWQQMQVRAISTVHAYAAPVLRHTNLYCTTFSCFSLPAVPVVPTCWQQMQGLLNVQPNSCTSL